MAAFELCFVCRNCMKLESYLIDNDFFKWNWKLNEFFDEHHNHRIKISLHKLGESYALRPMFVFGLGKVILNKKPLVGVEIGVDYGNNALTILDVCNMKELYLVDPYIEYSENGKVRMDCLNRENVLKEAMEKLKPYPNAVLVRKESSAALDEIPNELDFVYIDGNHEYAHVKEDIELYYPKVKIGGIIGGHDFYLNKIGVCKAVTEFIEKKNIKNYHQKEFDWWIVKENE